MDELATNIINTFKRSSTPTEAKLSLFNQLKSHIKHQRVPESAQAPTLECIRLAITSQFSSSLVASGFSALGHLIKRLTLQDQIAVVFSQRCHVIPAILERLGDVKESHRQAASQALCDLWPCKPVEIEKVVREGAIVEGHVRAKEAGMEWVTKMHAEQGLQFRSFVPHMVECLGDADGGVREAAKTNLIDLFSNGPDHAKADLKRQLVSHNVRSSIVSHILGQLQMSVPVEVDMKASTHSTFSHAQDHAATTTPVEHVPVSVSESIQIEPLHLHTQRELEDIFRDMTPCFEGRETEQNWIVRDKSVTKIRRLIKGNSPTDFQTIFVAGIKALMDGILKVANSLRTTMCTNGCQVVQELAKGLGAGLDPSVEILLQNFIKMCSATKNITAQQGNLTVEILLTYTTYHLRHSQHIWNATQDKNAAPRTFASAWAKIIIKKQMQNKQHFEHCGGLELAEKSIKKGLADANPKVREGMRSTYWVFNQGWPDKAEAIMDSLDPKSKQLLERDPGNPHPASGGTNFTASVGPSSFANPRAATSLRDAIAARKKAAAAAAATVSSRNLPERPSSAMSAFSPVRHTPAASRTAPNKDTRAVTDAGTQSASKQVVPPTRPAMQSQPSLMSAPVRRPRRPEMTRPATADPYAIRNVTRPTSPNRGAETSPARPIIRGSQSSMAVFHPNARSKSVASDDSNVGRTSRQTSPRTSPTRKRTGNMDTIIAGPRAPVVVATEHAVPSPVSVDDNFTMVIPKTYRMPAVPSRGRSETERPSAPSWAMSSMAEEDNFTLVIPQKSAVLGVAPPLTARANTPFSAPIIEKQSPQRANLDLDSHKFDVTKSKAGGQQTAIPEIAPYDNAGVEDLIVFEDPTAADIVVPMNQKEKHTVLEELPLNEQNQLFDVKDSNEGARKTTAGRRTPSPTKKSTAEQVNGHKLDASKVQKLLSSGVDKVQKGTLDAHGFRKLQDVIRQADQESAAQLVDLMVGLVDSLEHRRASGDGHVSKASTLQSQILSTIRLIVASKAGTNVLQVTLARALCAMISIKAQSDGSSMTMELDKTVDDIITRAPNTIDCIDSIASFTEQTAANSNPGTLGNNRMTTMALRVLSKILASTIGTISPAQQARLGRLAVKCLNDLDVEVRRADTEFCVELRDTFGLENEDGFWRVLSGARETQMNLIAYYIAKRRKSARVAEV